MSIKLSSTLQKGDPQLKYLLALSPRELKEDLSSHDRSRQQAAAAAIFTSLPPFYREMFQEDSTLASELRHTLNDRYLQHLKTNKLDVQHAVSRQYSTKTRLEAGNESRKFNIGNGHMLTAVQIQKLLLGALSTGRVNSIHDPAITVTHKVHGRCLLLRVDLFKDHKVLTVCSRKGSAVGLFCRWRDVTEAAAKDVWVESSASLGHCRLDPLDDRFNNELPASWTSLDAAEFRTIHELVPTLFQVAEQEGVEAITFIGEGTGENMTTLFDRETRCKIDENYQSAPPAIFFFTARTPSGRVYDHHQLVDWGLPVVDAIRSPAFERTKWSVKEVMDMWDREQGTVTVCDQKFAIPPIVEFAGKQLCGTHDSFPEHPIEGVAISFGPWVLKAKNPYYADKEEREEEEAAKAKTTK